MKECINEMDERRIGMARTEETDERMPTTKKNQQKLKCVNPFNHLYVWCLIFDIFREERRWS